MAATAPKRETFEWLVCAAVLVDGAMPWWEALGLPAPDRWNAMLEETGHPAHVTVKFDKRVWRTIPSEQPRVTRIERRLEEQIESCRDRSVREGLERALALVRSTGRQP